MGGGHLVLLRHGQSVWNQQNKFTGWADVPLSPRGEEEARRAAALMKHSMLTFDCAATSYLRRAICTLRLVLEEMDLAWLPTMTDWRLNERHYGALQGLNKDDAVARYGAAQVHQWRRGFSESPPPGPPAAAADHRYQTLAPVLGESLSDALKRVAACFRQRIEPSLVRGERVLVVAHGNSLRALIKHLEHIADEDIAELNIATATPMVYRFDEGYRADAPMRRRVLAEE